MESKTIYAFLHKIQENFKKNNNHSCFVLFPKVYKSIHTRNSYIIAYTLTNQNLMGDVGKTVIFLQKKEAQFVL